MSQTFVSSDLHFGHKFMTRLRAENTSGFPDREYFAPYVDGDIMKAVTFMDEVMIEQWNGTVRKNDVVHFLGDLSFYKEDETRKIFHQLNGQKHLTKGNHDPPWCEKLPWLSVKDFRRIKLDGQSFYCMHYPMATWPNAHKGTYHLHGHTHGNLHIPESTRMDVGVDCTGQVVMPLEECKELLDGKEYDFCDHHR